MAMERGRNWYGGLPSHLLGSVFSRLPLPDYLRCRAVCRDWCLLAEETPHNPCSPWLMMPQQHNAIDNKNKNNDYCLRQFYSVSERRSYEICIPCLRGLRCLGSSDGWLVLIDDLYELHLVNPITGASLRLPSISTFSNVTLVRHGSSKGYVSEDAGGKKKFYSLEQMTNSYYAKVVLFKSGSNISVFVIHGPYSHLAYAQPGDKSWNELGSRYVNFADIALHGGKLYGVLTQGSFVLIGDLASPLQAPQPLPSPRYPTDSCGAIHLLESADEKNLLLVSRHPNCQETKPMFSVFRLHEAEWVPVANLGECAIFVGGNRSLALSTRDLPELEGNCIYFTKFRKYCIYRIRNCLSIRERVCRDAGVFHLSDESTTPCYGGQFLRESHHCHVCTYNRIWPQYLWFMPSLSE